MFGIFLIQLENLLRNTKKLTSFSIIDKMVSSAENKATIIHFETKSSFHVK